ncbi:hypothetical protein [Pelomonas sp. V22]|nr:hypothetical protein [Pelomonas sp. V22]
MNSHLDITVQPLLVATGRLSLRPGHRLFMTQRSLKALEAPGTN